MQNIACLCHAVWGKEHLPFLFYLLFYLSIFRERERNTNVWLPLVRPLLGTWPTTQACALTGNQTGDPLVCSPVLNPLSQGYLPFLDCYMKSIL